MSIIENEREALLSVREAARFLGFSSSMVYKLVETRSIPHIRLGERIRFRAEELNSWVDARNVEVKK